MPTPDDLAEAYAAAWFERHPNARRALLDACCQSDVLFLQESSAAEIVGIEQLSDLIGQFQDAWPTDGEVTVQLTTPVQEHHGYGRGGFVWIFPGDQRGYGTDFVELREGKMATIVVFGDLGPPATGS
jgi:hypothetical protein